MVDPFSLTGLEIQGGRLLDSNVGSKKNTCGEIDALTTPTKSTQLHPMTALAQDSRWSYGRDEWINHFSSSDPGTPVSPLRGRPGSCIRAPESKMVVSRVVLPRTNNIDWDTRPSLAPQGGMGMRRHRISHTWSQRSMNLSHLM